MEAEAAVREIFFFFFFWEGDVSERLGVVVTGLAQGSRQAIDWGYSPKVEIGLAW